MKFHVSLSLLLLMSCTGAGQPPSPLPERSMDEVPTQRILQNGGREYRFANGCVIVLAADRAVVQTEGEVCALYQRDIALLYASGD